MSNTMISDVRANKFADRRRFLMTAKMPFTELELYQCERALAQWASQQLSEWSAAKRAITGVRISGPSFTASAMRLVNDERTKQLQRGYDRDHDATHQRGEIALAAAALAMRSASDSGFDQKAAIVWPWPEPMPEGTGKLQDAVKLIADERSRQQSQEGWTIEHDDCHECGELAQAAACYAIGKRIKYFNGWISFHGNGEEPRLTKLWPWGDDWWKPSAGDRIRDLVKAGALIVAEIERLQRKELQQKGGNA